MVSDASFGGTVQVKPGWDEETTAPGGGDTDAPGAWATPAVMSAATPTRQVIALRRVIALPIDDLSL
jgi:hypothetical protein